MSAVFVDTGAWIAIVSAADDLHAAALAHYRQLTGRGARLLTSNYVIDETATRLRYGAGLPAALRLRTSLREAVTARRLRIAWVDQAVEDEGWALLEQYADVKLSLTDAVSAAVARRARITEVFGFDQDFQAMGFSVGPPR